MEWLIGNSANFDQIELVSQKKNKYAIKLSPRPYLLPVDTEGEGEESSDIEYIEVIDTGIQSVDKVKQHLLNVLKEYDSSDEINVFYFNGTKHWIDVNKRNAIYHSCDLFEKDGIETYSLWVDNALVSLPISTVKKFLADLEKYAKSCYDVTAAHAANIKNLTKIEDILKYNVTTGYPAAIELNTYTD